VPPLGQSYCGLGLWREALLAGFMPATARRHTLLMLLVQVLVPSGPAWIRQCSPPLWARHSSCERSPPAAFAKLAGQRVVVRLGA
jgi:hypothetical protein